MFTAKMTSLRDKLQVEAVAKEEKEKEDKKVGQKITNQKKKKNESK